MFPYPRCPEAIAILEEEVVEKYRSPAQVDINNVVKKEPGSPILSELLEAPLATYLIDTAPNDVYHVDTPIGNLRVEKDPLTKAINIRPRSRKKNCFHYLLRQ